MRKKKITTIFLILISFIVFNRLEAQNISEEIKSIISKQPEDSYYYTFVYRKLESTKRADSVFVLLDKKLTTENARLINQLSYATAINKFGENSKSLKILEDINSKFNSLSIIVKIEYLSANGFISLQNQNPPQALKNFQKAIDLLDSTIKPEIYQSKYMNLGSALNANKRPEEAMKVYNKVLQMENGEGNRNSLYLRLNIALTNSDLGNYEKAKFFFKESLQILKNENDAFAEIRTYGNLGDIYLKQDSFKEANRCYMEGLKLAIRSNSVLDLIWFYGSMGAMYYKTGNFKLAYEQLYKSDSVKKNYITKDVSEKLIEMEMQNKIKEEKLKKEFSEQLLKSEQIKKTILIIFFIFVLITCVFLIRQLSILKQKNKVLLEKSLQSIKSVNILKTKNTSNDVYTDLIVSLNDIIFNEKAYTNSDLTLDKLAKQLKTNRTYLSEAINNTFNVSFSQWINNIRIEEAKKMLTAKEFDIFSIEGIANMVGVSSISAFNSNFKKITGLTPSYFRKNRDLANNFSE
ncbi:MAG: tetratricopeptide repeat protein [Bacteroidota bacterium]